MLLIFAAFELGKCGGKRGMMVRCTAYVDYLEVKNFVCGFIHKAADKYFSINQVIHGTGEWGKTSDVPLCHKSSLCSLTEILNEFNIFGTRSVIHIPNFWNTIFGIMIVHAITYYGIAVYCLFLLARLAIY
jgi:hypothetical protein